MPLTTPKEWFNLTVGEIASDEEEIELYRKIQNEALEAAALKCLSMRIYKNRFIPIQEMEGYERAAKAIRALKGEPK